MKFEHLTRFVNESFDFKSLLFEDWFGSEWIENAPSHQVGFVVKSWADNLIVNHIESRMNFILHLNQEIDCMDVSNEIRVKGFGTKIEKLESIIKEKEITSAYDFLGALKLLRVLRNQCSHSYK